jgi:hypothetical protein
MPPSGAARPRGYSHAVARGLRHAGGGRPPPFRGLSPCPPPRGLGVFTYNSPPASPDLLTTPVAAVLRTAYSSSYC